ncbi:MAG: hypothetical protein JO027_14275 [Solirubrobacterales bacterium]|nr:hypothetical protein [Solirubrobacterales bacterium]
MISSDVSYIVAKQRIAELQRAAAHERAAHAIREPRKADTFATRAIRGLRPRRAAAQPASRQDPTVGIAADTRVLR